MPDGSLHNSHIMQQSCSLHLPVCQPIQGKRALAAIQQERQVAHTDILMYHSIPELEFGFAIVPIVTSGQHPQGLLC